MELNTIQKIAVYSVPLIFAITLHEAAHAYAAKRLGDPTAYLLGRVTLNPLKHIDPIWTVLVPILTMLFSPFVFGAAKPVPVDFGALRRPKQDMIWVAAAGPGANLLMMVGWAMVAKLALQFPPTLPTTYFLLVAQAGIFVNALLMVFNLFPLLPLDGGRILVGLLPARMAYAFSRTEPYGMLVLIVLILTGALSAVLWPLVSLALDAVYLSLGLS